MFNGTAQLSRLIVKRDGNASFSMMKMTKFALDKNLFGGPGNELTYKINWQGEGLRNISAH